MKTPHPHTPGPDFDETLRETLAARDAHAPRDLRAEIHARLDQAEAQRRKRPALWLSGFGLAAACAAAVWAVALWRTEAPPDATPPGTREGDSDMVQRAAVPRFSVPAMTLDSRPLTRALADDVEATQAELQMVADRLLQDTAAPMRSFLAAAERAQQAALEAEEKPSLLLEEGQPTSSAPPSPSDDPRLV